MGGIFGGSDSNKKETTTVVNNPYPAAKPGLDQYYKDLQRTYQAGGLYMNPFPGQTVAPTSPETSQAWTGTANRAMAGSDLNRAAQSQILARLDPSYLTTQSPELQAVIDNARQGVNAEFSRAGRTFSGAHAGGLGASEGQLRYQDLLRKAGEQQYAIGMAPQLAREDYFDLDRLGQVGSQREGHLQDLINAEIERFNALQSGRANELGLYNSLLAGGGTGSTSTTSPVRRDNPLLSGLSATTGFASLFL